MQLLTPEQYQSRAHAIFLDTKARLQPLLPDARIEHVGASSIPGAISKGDLDICVVVDADGHEATVQRLLEVGYDLKQDTLRTPELCMLEAKWTEHPGIDTALQVIAAGSRFEFFMRFRDRLRASTALVAEYNRLKTDHAPQGEDAYRRAKSAFIEAVLNNAGAIPAIEAESRTSDSHVATHAAPADFSGLALRTTRLSLRPLQNADALPLFSIFSDHEFMRYWSCPPWTHMDQAHDLIARDQKELAAGEHLRLGIVLTPSRELIGTCSLFNINWTCRRAEIGYGIARPHWRQGYVTEALEALIEHAFIAMNLNRLEADIDPRNTASERSLQRLGFHLEGLLRERWIVAGETSDSALYGLLASQWRAQRR